MLADSIADACHDERHADDGTSAIWCARNLVDVFGLFALGSNALVCMERSCWQSQVPFKVREGQGDGFLLAAENHPTRQTWIGAVAEDR